ncbi:MAG: hypothetical protein AB2A00_25960 [Myxococcota bacterium]
MTSVQGLRGVVVARWLVALAALYGVTVVVTAGIWWGVVDGLGRTIAPLDPSRNARFTVTFITFFTPLLYLFTSALARRWLRPDPAQLLLTMGATFFCALLAEVGCDALFVLVVGRPCWEYHVWPVHHGYTSGVGLLMWPLYGLFVHLLHQALEENPRLRALDNLPAKAVLVGVDAMVLEVAANTFSLVAFNTFYFRYHAGDLHHFTTAEVFVPYVVAGYVGLHLLERLRGVPHPAWVGAALWVVAGGLLSVI